jgi:hypothetical protein
VDSVFPIRKVFSLATTCITDSDPCEAKERKPKRSVFINRNKLPILANLDFDLLAIRLLHVGYRFLNLGGEHLTIELFHRQKPILKMPGQRARKSQQTVSYP